MADEILPNIYIIGAQKSGTTSLFDWIGQHPDVYANRATKDYPFFTDETLYTHRRKDFFKMFRNGASKRVILGGDANLMYVRKAVERMCTLIPDAKLIAILRNPVNRAFSAWCHAAERGLEKRTFLEAIEEEMKGKTIPPHTRDGRQKNYIEHGLYAQQLERVFQFYPKDRVMVLIFEEVIKDPAGEIKKVFRFIGVDDSFVPNFSIKNKTLGGQRFKILSKLLYKGKPHGHPVWEILRFLIPKNLRTTIRLKLETYNRVAAPKPSFPENVYITLRDYYSEEISRLEELLGRSFDVWRSKS